MIQNTAKRFLILIQHPEKSTFLVSDQIRKVGLIGSILLDLSINKNIDIVTGKLKVNSTESNLPKTHKQILEQISNSRKTKKIKTWISRFSRQSGKYQKEILDALEAQGLIKIEHKKFLFFKYYKTRLINNKLREEIISEIRDIVFNEKQIDNEKAAILGLIEACKLHKVICMDKKEIRICKSKLKDIIKSNSISQGVDKVIKEMQAAIIAVVVSSTVAATVASN